MKNYFKRLKNHPGIPFAIMLTIVFCAAGVSNESLNFNQGIVVGLIISAVFPWSIIFLTA